MASYGRGKLPPKPIQDAPDPIEGLSFYLRAFYELSTCRPIGYGAVGPIPWTSIVEYGRVHEADGEILDELVYLVRVLDNEYLEWENKKKPKG